MKQGIIGAILVSYLGTATLAANKQLEFSSQSAAHFSQITPRYIGTHLFSRYEPSSEHPYPRSLDYSLLFPEESHLGHRDLDDSVSAIEKRADLDQKRPGSATSTSPPTSNSQGTRPHSPIRASDSRNPAQNDAKVIVNKKGGTTWSYVASEPAQQPVDRHLTWSGASGQSVVGIANARGPHDKLKLDASGKQAVADVYMTGPGNAILQSHGPQGSDTKMLVGGPRDLNDMFNPQHQAIVGASSNNPIRNAAVSVKTTGAVHARVRASMN